MTPAVDPFRRLFDQPVRLVNDERGRFYVAGDGITEQALPSISSVIQENRLGADYSQIPMWMLNKKAKIGTALHKVAEIFLSGQDVDMSSVHADVAPYVISLRRFLSEHVLEARMLETAVRSDLFACTLDFAGLYDGKPGVIDFKTTSRIHKLSVGVQVEGQARCLAGPLNRYAVQFKKDGTYKEVDLNDPWYSEVLDAALTLMRARGRASI